MQAKLKEEIDADRNENYVSITDYKTGQNICEINCGACFKTFYADKVTFESINRAIEQALDNPFICGECQQEYEELACEER